MPAFDKDQFPANAIGRARLEEYVESEQDPIERGKGFLRLSHIYKHLGTNRGVNIWVATSAAAEEAVKLLKGAEDRLLYARALRASCMPFINLEHVDKTERLTEALRIAQEENSFVEIGWTHWALNANRINADGVNSENFHKEAAIEALRASGDPQSIAFVLQNEAISMVWGSVNYKRKSSLFAEAGRLYEQGGAYADAARAYELAVTFGDDFLSRRQESLYFQSAIRCAHNASTPVGPIRMHKARLTRKRNSKR